MSTQPTQPTPVQTEPIAMTLTGGTLSDVLAILSSALSVLSEIPATAAGAALASVIIQIITAAVTRVQSQTGKPIDLSLIPVETPLP